MHKHTNYTTPAHTHRCGLTDITLHTCTCSQRIMGNACVWQRQVQLHSCKHTGTYHTYVIC